MVKNDYLKYILIFIAIVLLQVLVFNNFIPQVFGINVIPIIYTYFLIKLPIGMNRISLIILGFILGFTVDIFSNTPGLNAMVATFIGFIRQSVMNLFFSIDDFEGLEPSEASLSITTFYKYTLLLLFINVALVIVLETFNTTNLITKLSSILLSTLFSLVFIVCFEKILTPNQTQH